MKTVCLLNNKVIMSQDGEAVEAMTLNAQQYSSSTVQVVTDDEFAALINTTETKLASCKSQAKSLLAKTDWAVLPDVGLTNSAEYVTYRATLRGLVLNPVENPTFPTEPTPVWSN